MYQKFTLPILGLFILLSACGKSSQKEMTQINSVKESEEQLKDTLSPTNTNNKDWLAYVVIEKALLYDQHTLDDVYPYKDTTRVFQWDKIKYYLAIVDSIQEKKHEWAIVQNRSNVNGQAPLTRSYKRNEYALIVDTFGTDRQQNIPLYLLSDTLAPERYLLDGSPIKIQKRDTVSGTKFVEVATVKIPGIWKVPEKYIKFIGDTIQFNRVIMVDRTNQNISTYEKENEKWLVRSMNPATTGAHRPPIQKRTPLGIFVLQEKKIKMFYTEDHSSEIAGFAPYANRFCQGGYVHGVPVNYPHKDIVEFSATLGTIPRSHMCVRTASSHSKFIYGWAPVNSSLVIVFD